jgi:MOSC domain-containing protein YiiM
MGAGPVGRLVQVSVSPGGVPKRPVPAARVTPLGLEGDRQRDLEHHGGPDRALCLFSLERIEALQAEGHSIEPGTIGENLTVAGIDWNAVGPDDHLRLGEEVLIQVTRYTSPCLNIRGAFLDGQYGRVSPGRHPGWSRVYARVLVPGEIRAADPVVRLTPAEAAAHQARMARSGAAR